MRLVGSRSSHNHHPPEAGYGGYGKKPRPVKCLWLLVTLILLILHRNHRNPIDLAGLIPATLETCAFNPTVTAPLQGLPANPAPASHSVAAQPLRAAPATMALRSIPAAMTARGRCRRAALSRPRSI